MLSINRSDSELQSMLISTLQREVTPAMGCTEPVAVALAVAKARELLSDQEDVLKISVSVSPNIYKNGLAVGIPGTREVGLVIAAALGFTSGDSKNDLKVLSTVSETDLPKAKALIQSGILELNMLDTSHKVHIEVVINSKNSDSKAIIMDRHNQFVYLKSDGNILLNTEISSDFTAACENPLLDESFITLIKTIEAVPYESIEFLLQGATMNRLVADYGLQNSAGMQVGKTLQSKVEKGLLTDDLMTRAMILTSSASDARMDGISLPVMSSNGSGNNGLTAILPIVAYSELHSTDAESMARAIAMSHIVNSYIKNAIGRLSALCGCGVAAGTGASVAISWLMGGNYAQLEATVKNMLANTSGMICDGAKVGCALKLATSASAAIQSALLATSDICVPAHNGIIGDTVEKTVDNLRILSNEGMMKTDAVMLDIMRSMQQDEMLSSLS